MYTTYFEGLFKKENGKKGKTMKGKEPVAEPRNFERGSELHLIEGNLAEISKNTTKNLEKTQLL